MPGENDKRKCASLRRLWKAPGGSRGWSGLILPRAGFSAIILLAALSALQPALAATVTVDYNNEHQTIEGWGASSNFAENTVTNMKEPYRSDVYDVMFDDLGTNILCIRLYPDFQPSEGAPYAWTAMDRQRWIMNAARVRNNIDYVWIKVSSPPGWMKNNGDHANGGHVLPEYYDDYAQYLVDYISGMEDFWGFTTDAVSMFNEPGFGEPGVDYDSTDTDPTQYRDILKVVGAKFAAEGLPEVLMGTESGKISDTDSGALGAGYMQAIFNDPVATGYLHHVSVHQYGDIGWLWGVLPPDDWPGLLALSSAHGKNIWETEVMMGGGEGGAHDIVEGLNSGKLIWRAMTVGHVTAWHYWHYYWFAHDERGHEYPPSGILSIEDDTVYYLLPRYYVIKQWAKLVKPGAVCVEATDDHADIYAAAFKRNNQVFIVALNYGTSAVPVTFNCTAISGPVGHIRTSATENYVTQPNVSPTGNSFSTTMPARSISTFVVPFNPAARAPVADFTAKPRWGAGRAKVSFTDASTNYPTSWAWDFDNNGTTDSTEHNPTHVYDRAGRYTVKLTAANAQGSNSKTRIGYVKVSPPGIATDANGHSIVNGRAEDTQTPWQTFTFDPSTLYSYGCPTGVALAAPQIVTDPTDATNKVVQLVSQSYSSRRQSGGCATMTGINTSGESIEDIQSIACRIYVPPGTTRDLWVGTIWLDFNDNDQFHYTNDVLTSNLVGYLQDGWNRVAVDTKTDGHVGTTPKQFSANDGEVRMGFFFATNVGVGSLNIYVDDLEFISSGPPVDFTASPRVGRPPLQVQFTDETAGEVDTWEWDFGDSGTSSQQNPLHTYTSPGIYTVTLTATGASGAGQKTRERYVHVVSGADGVIIKNQGGASVASFTPAGDLLLKGTLTEQATPSPSGSAGEFVVKGTSDNPVAVITSAGDMIIKGTAHELQDEPLFAPANTFAVKDGSGRTASYIDPNGDLYLLGGVLESAL